MCIRDRDKPPANAIALPPPKRGLTDEQWADIAYCLRVLIDYLDLLHDWQERYKPATPEEPHETCIRDRDMVYRLRINPKPAHFFGKAVVVISRIDHNGRIAFAVEEDVHHPFTHAGNILVDPAGVQRLEDFLAPVHAAHCFSLKFRCFFRHDYTSFLCCDAQPAPFIFVALNLTKSCLFQILFQCSVRIDGHAIDDLRPFVVFCCFAVCFIADEKDPAGLQHSINLSELLRKFRPEIDRFKGGHYIKLLRFKRQFCHTCLLHGTPSCRNGSGIDLSRLFHADS